MTWKQFKYKLRYKWAKLRLRHIRILCFHHVSDEFDESTMYPGDWISTDEFKKRVQSLREQGYRFISLVEAHEHIKHDFIRTRKYVVLTADDGWASLKNILPWLNEQQIPITLFLNPAYLDGKHFRERNTEKYLTEKEVNQLYKLYPLLTIGSHGWEHLPAPKQTTQEFTDNVLKSYEYLSKLPNFVPYFAYTWGWNWYHTDGIVLKCHMTPINLCGKNYSNGYFLHRENIN